MSWRRPLRIGIAVVGVSVAVALVALRRDRVLPAPIEPGMPTDPAAVSESAGGRVERLRDGQLEFTIEHAGQRTYAEGLTEFLQARVRFNRTGRELRADRLETRGQFANAAGPLKLELSGNVELVQGEAMRVETDAATYDDQSGTLNIPGRVVFQKGGLAGSGTGATYEESADIFRVLADARARVEAAADGSGSLDLSAGRMSLARDENYLQLDGDARIMRQNETLSGDNATLAFVDAEGGVRFLELRGHARVEPAAGTSNVPAMQANDITLAFEPTSRTLEHATLTGAASVHLRERGGDRSVAASWIDLYLAPDGRTVTRLDGRDRVVVTLPAQADTPAREIRAASLVARGTATAGLQSAVFEKDASFRELRPAARGREAESRSGRAERLELALDGGLDAIREAVFRSQVVFDAGVNAAEADLARYDARAGRLVLETAASSRRPRVRRQDGSLTVEARTIDLSLDSEGLSAEGRVTTVSRDAEGERSSTLFEAGKPVYGSADRFDYESGSATATYRGSAGEPARVEQGDNRVTAGEIRIEERTNNLRARSAVETAFLEVATEGGAEPRLSEVFADALVYDDATRKATYDGSVRFRSDDSETTADRLELELAPSRAVLAFDAIGSPVFSALVGGREAKGDRLRYDGKTKAYTLLGAPAQAKSPNESGTDCVLSIGPRIVFIPGGRASGQSAGGAPTETRQISCAVSIR